MPDKPDKEEFIQSITTQAVAKFPKKTGKIVVNYLFRTGRNRHFRVNWWENSEVVFSVFVTAIIKDKIINCLFMDN